jgi:Flp pilus assembly protein TadG
MKSARVFLGRVREERGQALPLVIIAAVVLIGFTGLAVDLGRVWVAKQQLQRSVDAAALVAGQDLPNTTTAYSAAVSYAGTGTTNPIGGWGVKPANASVTFECVSHAPDYTTGTTPTCLTDTSGASCHPSNSQGPSNPPTPSGVTTCNAVNVTESATVTTGLLSMFIPSFKITASSTASARQLGVPNPMNVFVIMDTTDSMTDACSATVPGIKAPKTPEKLDCAKAGVRTLLGALQPCSSTDTTCGSDVSGDNVQDPVDEVGLLVFPAVSMTLGTKNGAYVLSGPSSTSPNYLNQEIDCNANDSLPVTYPPYVTYTNGVIPITNLAAFDDPNSDNYAGYEAVGLSSDYRTSDSTASLNLTSPIVESVDWGQCPNGAYPGGNYYGLKDIGGQGSYLAGAITEAQYLLQTAPTRTGPDGQNVTNAIIILSDGELNDPKKYVSGSSGAFKDGVDPGASGNKGWTSSTPCEDAIQAANQAKTAGTIIFSIAYDDQNASCDDSSSGSGTIYTGSASTLMQDLASGPSDFFSQATAGDLTQAFSVAGSQLTGDSALIPDCTQAPPNC